MRLTSFLFSLSLPSPLFFPSLLFSSGLSRLVPLPLSCLHLPGRHLYMQRPPILALLPSPTRMCSVKTALLLSGLAALATAQDPMVKVEPDDIPFGCATICGPIVELTDICHVGSHPGFRRRLKRRKIEKRQSVTNAFGLVVPAPERTPTGGRVVTVTTVVTLTATPSQAVAPGSAITTPAAGSNNPSSQVMTTTMTMVLLEDDTDGGDLELPADDTGVRLAFPTTTSTPLAVGNAADGIDMGDVYEYAEQETEVEDAERDCVCNNKSFDVALVSGLCTSCIQQAGWAPECKFLFFCRFAFFIRFPFCLLSSRLKLILKLSHGCDHGSMSIRRTSIHRQKRRRRQQRPHQGRSAYSTRRHRFFSHQRLAALTAPRDRIRRGAGGGSRVRPRPPIINTQFFFSSTH